MIYLFTGDNEFAIEQKVLELKEAHQVSSLYFERTTAGKSEADKDALSQRLRDALTFSLDGSLKLLWVQNLPIAATTLGLARIQAYLEDLCGPHAPSMVVISSSTIDGRLGLARWLKANAECRDFSLIPPWDKEQLLAQARAIGAKAGVRLSSRAAGAIVKQVGNSPRLAYQAIELLALHGGEVTPELVERLVPMQTNDGVALARALLKRDVLAAMAELERLITQAEPPLRLVALIGYQVRQWIAVKAAVEFTSGADNAVIARLINLSGNPNRLYYLKQEVEPVTLEMLMKLSRLIVATEKTLKSTGGKATEVQALRDLVLAVGRVVDTPASPGGNAT